MADKEAAFALALLGGAMDTERQAAALMRCNETAGSGGLTLTRQQALALAETRRQALEKTGRIELGGGIQPLLVEAFRDSPYLTKDSFAPALHELTELFYACKNETGDRVSDRALIAWMRQAFNGACRGSTELLGSRAMDELARRVRAGTAPRAFGEAARTDG